MNGLKELILGRRSVRKYKERTISREYIDYLLDMAVYAPTASNIQPWFFGVIQNKDTIRSIEAFSPGMPKGSNVLIAVCSDRELSQNKGGNPVLSTMDCAFAGENMVLAAYELGIGSCIVCSFNRAGVSLILDLPDHLYLEYLVTLGYGANEPETPFRRPVKTVSFSERWGNQYGE